MWTPWAASYDWCIWDRAEQRQGEIDLVFGVQRAVEIYDDLGARGAQQLLRVRGRPAPRHLPRRAGRGRRTRPVPSRSSAAAALGIATVTSGIALGELHLELRRVQQDEPGKLGCRRRAHDRAAEPLRDEQRQQAAVVEVGMGEDDRVERRRVEAERDAIAHRVRLGRPGTCRSR